MFNKITIKEVSEIEDFFSDKDSVLAEAEDCYIENEYNYLKAQGAAYSGNLLNIVSDWDMENRALEYNINILNSSLWYAFYDLNEKFLEYEHFEEFLDDLCIETYHNKAEVSSSRSGYTCRCFSYDYLTEVIDSYLQEIVKRKDVAFLGFDVGDEFYWCCLSEKFGYPPDEDEEKENEDTDE